MPRSPAGVFKARCRRVGRLRRYGPVRPLPVHPINFVPHHFQASEKSRLRRLIRGSKWRRDELENADIGVTTRHAGTDMPCESANCLFRDRWVSASSPHLSISVARRSRGLHHSRSISGAEHQLSISLANLNWSAKGPADRSQGDAQLCAQAEGRREESAPRAWDCTRGSPSHLASQTSASRPESASL